MSYAPISWRNEIGVKKLPGLSGQIRFLSGLRGGMGALGQDVSQGDLEDAGVDPGIATTLLALGATDDQLDAVIADPDSADAAISLLQELTGSSPAQAMQSSAPSALPISIPPPPTAAGAAAAASVNSTPAASASAPSFLPAGAQLGYTLAGGSLSISEAISTWTWTSVVAQLSSYLQQNSGIIITGSNASGNPLSLETGFSCTVQLVQPYTNALLVKQVIDQALAGLGVAGSSNISVINAGAAPLGSPPPAGAPGGLSTQTITQWLESNWYLVAAAVAVVVVAPVIAKKL